MKNIIVGTAAWRSIYGKNSRTLSLDEVHDLVNFFSKQQLHHFDTAANYGDVANILLEMKNDLLKLDTKFDDLKSPFDLKEKISKMPLDKINTIFFHDPNIIKHNSTSSISDFIKIINANNIFAGFSLYEVHQLHLAVSQFNDEVVFQLPCNIFDLRFLKYIHENSLDIKRFSFRSIFARGLIFLSDQKIKKILKAHNEDVNKEFMRLFSVEYNAINLQALTFSLINFLLEQGFKIVVGINSQKEYYHLLESTEKSLNNIDWYEISYLAQNLLKMEDLTFK